MLLVLKRYSMAFTFLFIIFALMLLSTIGVTSLGNSMLNDIGEEMKPRGEEISR
ncbi:MAG: hypothetical protein JJW00_01835 [Sulfurimonas sp.]|nr:hypothetical protein [Sulfurimonas sp.]